MKKNRIIIICALLLTVLLQGCEDYLAEDPRGELYASEFYTTSTAAAETATNGLFNLYTDPSSGSLSGINTYGVTPAAQRYISYLTDVTGEDVWVKNTGKSSRQNLDRYLYGTDNDQIEFMYFSFYRSIKETNSVIFAMQDELTDFSREFETEEQAKAFQNRLLGTALTIRAYMYFSIVRFWGDAAVIDKPIVIGEEVDGSRRNFAEVYRDVIIADLVEVIDGGYLNTQSSGGSNEVTEGAAKALLADVYLNLAGTAYDKQNGVIADSRNELLEKCVALCKSLNSDYGYDLYPNFFDLFTVKGNYSAESIWELHTEQNEFAREALPRDGRDGGPHEFYPFINALTGETEYYTARGRYAMGDNLHASHDQDYDTRLEHVRDVQNEYKASERDGLIIQTWSTTKYGDSTIVARGKDNLGASIVAWKLYRFANVLLMWAEAENELRGPTGDAVSAYERVRTRAYRGNEGQIGVTPAGQDEFREAVWLERRKELFLEGFRRFDLIRTGTLEKVADEPSGHNHNYYPIFESKHYLYPIPAIAFALNPELGVQNPGWGGE